MLPDYGPFPSRVLKHGPLVLRASLVWHSPWPFNSNRDAGAQGWSRSTPILAGQTLACCRSSALKRRGMPEHYFAVSGSPVDSSASSVALLRLGSGMLRIRGGGGWGGGWGGGGVGGGGGAGCKRSPIYPCKHKL